jgi:hypothetical protein
MKYLYSNRKSVKSIQNKMTSLEVQIEVLDSKDDYQGIKPLYAQWQKLNDQLKQYSLEEV